MKRELARKSFHVASVAVPLLVWVAPELVASAALAALAIVAVAVDMARLSFRFPRYHFLRLTRRMLRPHERRRLAGATWMALAYAAAVFFFPKHIAVAAMLFNGLGDAAAALVGKRWGRHRTRWGKSWEGFAAGLAVNLAAGIGVALLSGRVPVLAAVAGAVVAASLEMADLPIDDNVRVTLGGGLAATAVAMLS
ncbi:MAG TPA: hypothetical protein VFQ39_03810 [Longimicrobium sp.]|nr:hypothetical protein [Longimicrobium sp.]